MVQGATQSPVCSDNKSSKQIRLDSLTASVSLRITIPSVTGVAQASGLPRAPSISTRHSIQAPKASMRWSLHKFGISTPCAKAACKTDVPASVSKVCPLIVKCILLIIILLTPQSRRRIGKQPYKFRSEYKFLDQSHGSYALPRLCSELDSFVHK